MYSAYITAIKRPYLRELPRALGAVIGAAILAALSSILLACRPAPALDPIKRLQLPLMANESISSIALIHNQKHRGLNGFALALGQGGAVIYDMDGDEIWRDNIPAKLVAYDGRALLVYRDHGSKTILDRYSATDMRYILFEDRQSPSEIAATTLQRTAFSSLGAVTLSGSDVKLFNTDRSVVSYRSKLPIAAIASTSKPMPYFPSGVVVISSSDGELEFLSEDGFRSRLK